jgi:hypothetical protein
MRTTTMTKRSYSPPKALQYDDDKDEEDKEDAQGDKETMTKR